MGSREAVAPLVLVRPAREGVPAARVVLPSIGWDDELEPSVQDALDRAMAVIA